MADALYHRRWRAAHPEYRARQNRLRNERRRRLGRGDRSAEYRRRASRALPAIPGLHDGHDLFEQAHRIVGPKRRSLSTLHDPLHEDLLSEATLALLEGRDPADAVRSYGARERSYGRITCQLFERCLSRPGSRPCTSLTAGRATRSIRTQPKSSYQEWQRDRPGEATTTYRRSRQGAKSGQVLLHDKGTPFGAPLPSKTVARTPVPRRSAQPPGEPTWRSRPSQPRPTPTAPHPSACAVATAAPRSRSALVLRLSGLLRAARGRLRLRRRRRDADPRGDRRPRARASGATPSCCRSTRRRRVACRSARRRCSPPTGWRRILGLDRLWIKDDTRNPSLSASRTGRSRSPRPAPSSSASRRSPARRPATWPARRPRPRRRSGCRPTSSSRPTSSRPRSTTRWPTARRSSRSRAPTTTSTGCASRSPTRPAGASSTSTSGRSTPRARRRSPTRSPSRSAGGRRTSSSRRSPRARCSRRVARGFEELVELGLIDRRPIRFVGGQAAGCAPVATAWAAGTDVIEPVRTPDTIVRSLAIGNPADGRYVGRARATRADGSVEAIEDEVTAAAIRDVARLEGIYPETAGGVTLAAAAAARRRGRHPARRRGRRAADRERPQDARRTARSGMADGVARPGRAGPRAGHPPEPVGLRALAGRRRGMSTVRIPPTLRDRDRRGEAGRGPGRHGPRGRRRPGRAPSGPRGAAHRPGRRPQPVRQRVPQRHRHPPPRGARHAGRRRATRSSSCRRWPAARWSAV